MQLSASETVSDSPAPFTVRLTVRFDSKNKPPLPHNSAVDLKATVGGLIHEVFQKRNDIVRDGQNHQCQWWLQLFQSQAVWVGGANRKPNSRWVQTFNADRVCSVLDKLVDSTFITLGKGSFGRG